MSRYVDAEPVEVALPKASAIGNSGHLERLAGNRSIVRGDDLSTYTGQLERSNRNRRTPQHSGWLMLAPDLWRGKRGESDTDAGSHEHCHFQKTLFSPGIGFHEARVADLNGDGLPDLLDKPYNWETPRVDVWLQMRARPDSAMLSDPWGNRSAKPK